MGEQQPASSGAESASPKAEADPPKAEAAPSAVVPPRTVPRPFALRPLILRPFILRPSVPRPRVPPAEPPRAGAYTDPVTWVTGVAAFGAYAAISLFRLMQLNPSSWDLGIYTEYVKRYADLSAPIVDIRAPGFNLLGDHFQPIVAVLAPFFRVFPSSATLLVGQALLAAASIFPVSQLAREKLGVGPGRAIAVAYGFSWGLQQLAQFDFHEIAFAVPLLAFSLSALARGHTKAAVGWALPLVFVKEDQGFTVAAIGIYLIVAGLRAQIPDPRNPADPNGRGRMKAGQFLLIWGFAWSFVAIGVIIPHFNPVHLYQYWSDGGVLAPGGHPSVLGVIRQLLHAWPDKLQTLVMLLLPTAFIALRSPLVLIAAPSLLLRFIATDSSFWGTYWHYNATVMPIIFVAAIDALARIDAAMDADRRRRAGCLGQRAARAMAGGAGRSPPLRRGHDGRDRDPAGLPVPAQPAVERPDLPDQPARSRGRRGHGPGARRRQRPDHAGPAGPARRPDRYLLDRQQRQSADPVHRLRRPRQRLQPRDQERSRLHREPVPAPHVYRDLLLRRRLRLPPHPLTPPNAVNPGVHRENKVNPGFHRVQPGGAATEDVLVGR